MNKRRAVTAIALVLLQSCVVAPKVNIAPPRTVLSPKYRAETYNRLAVYVESQARVDQGTLRSVEDAFITTLLQNGYVVAARSDLDTVLREQGTQASSSTEMRLARAGKALNVAGIILVSINSLEFGRYTPPPTGFRLQTMPADQEYERTADISARLVSAEQAETIWISTVDGQEITDQNNRDSHHFLETLAAELAREFPTRYGAMVPENEVGAFNQVATSAKFNTRNYSRIAVYLGSTRLSSGMQRRLEDAFGQALIGKGYTFVARSDLQTVLRELRIQASTSTETALARAGRQLNVDGILVVDVTHATVDSYKPRGTSGTRLRAQAGISARLIGVELAEIVWISTRYGSVFTGDRNGDDDLVIDLARASASDLPRRDSRIPPVR